MGDPITNLGGAVIPAPRQALRHAIAISTLAPDGVTDLVADRMRIRRQLRSMLNNTPLKLQAFLYVQYSDDPEQNGWYVPDFGQLVDIDGSAGLATGVWKLEQVAWIMAGHQRTNREARNIWMKDLRTGLPWRDTLKAIYSTNFSGLTAIQLVILPHGATQIINTVSGQVQVPASLLTGRDGGVCKLCASTTGTQTAGPLSDLSCLSFERPESAFGLSDVIVKDRRGGITGPFYAANILEDHPTSYWRVNETSGITATDSGGGGNNATYSAAGITLNQTGALVNGGDNDASVQLNGSTGSISCPTISFGGGDFTLEFWSFFTGGGVQGQVFSGPGGAAGTCRVIVRQGPGGGIYFGITPAGAGGETVLQPVTASNVSVWVHWACVRTGGTIAIYRNGVQVTGAGTTGPALGSANVSISALALTSYTGKLDEIAVYNRALSPLQIANHYAAGITYDGGNQWEEAYGPDYPWNWLTAGQANDAPILDNGLCRVRYDQSVGSPGFSVDVWDGSQWVEQGKLVIDRVGDVTGYTTTYISAGLHTDGNGWTPDRAVVQVVLANPSDTSSRERIFITMSRGQVGATFEVYPALKVGGTGADVALVWTPAATDVNDSIMKNDSATDTGPPGTGKIVATAGTGSSNIANSAVGNATFATSGNWMALLRCSAVQTLTPYQTNFAVLQSGVQGNTGNGNTVAYGVSRNHFDVQSNGLASGYCFMEISFAPTAADQVMEAESMTLGTNTTSAADGAASNGNTTQSTRTTDANLHVSKVAWPNSAAGAYRVFARYKVSANSASLFAKTGAAAAATVSGLNSLTYVWVDLGEVTANNSTFEIHAWMSGGAGTVSIDRVEAFLVHERTQPGRYSGARDLGQSILFDSRTTGAVVSR